MAQAQASKSTGTTPKNSTNTAPASAAGSVQWDDDIAEPDIGGFWKEELARVVVGQIVGFKRMKTSLRGNKMMEVVIFKLLEPVKAVGKKDGSKVEIELQVGETLAVPVKAKSLPLLEYVENRCVVRIEALEKVDIGAGQTMWKYKIQPAKGSKIGAPPKASAIASGNEAPDTDEPEVDFP